MNKKDIHIHELIQIISEIEDDLRLNYPDFEKQSTRLAKNFNELRLKISSAVNNKKMKAAGTYNKRKNIFDKVPSCIFYFNSSGFITECKGDIQQICGSSKENLIGRNLKNLPDKNLVSAAKKVLAGNSSKYEGFFTLVPSDKSKPVRVYLEPVFDQYKEADGGIGIVEDLSGIFVTEAALRESEKRFRKLFFNNNNVMLIIDPEDGSVFEANSAAEKFYGWKAKELKKKNISQFFISTGENLKKELAAALSGEKNFFLFKQKLANGSLRDLELYCNRITLAGRDYLYTIVNDITDHVKAEQDLAKFRLGINRSYNAVFITDINGIIEYVNPAFEKLYGYSGHEIVGKTPRILKSGYQSGEFYTDYWNKITSGKVSKGEIINKTKTGELLTISYSSNPIIDNDGKIIGFLAIQEDITARKKIEENLRMALYEKEVMLAEIHHRVKNNLAMVSAMMLLQAEHAENDELKTKLHDSTNRIKAIANIHEHLYESSNFSHINYTENLSRLIINIVNTLQTSTNITVKKGNNHITLNVNQAVYCSLILNEVVTNIVKHAFKDRKSGYIKLDTQENNQEVLIHISDNGNPLPDGFQSAEFGSLGIELIHILSRQLNADIDYQPLKKGTIFTLAFQKNESGNNHAVMD